MTEQPTAAELDDLRRAIRTFGGGPATDAITAAVIQAGFRCDSAMAENIRATKSRAWSEGYRAGEWDADEPVQTKHNPYT